LKGIWAVPVIASILIFGILSFSLTVFVAASDVTVESFQKISSTQGGFSGNLDAQDTMGRGLTSLGDLDEDGVPDLAAGSIDDDGGTDRGAIWILFLNSDGTVKSEQKISDTEGGFDGILDNGDMLGWPVASLGDLDGDGITDIAAGAFRDDDGGTDRGAIWILFLNSDGTVKSEQKISDTEGGFNGVIDANDFGFSISEIGDIDGDEVTDIVVGERTDDDGGAVWILFLNSDGTVKSEQKISNTEGNLGNVLENTANFGSAVGKIGDLDGDGVNDIVVGAPETDDGGLSKGAVWILFLNSDGTVKDKQKISETSGGFGESLDEVGRFGQSVRGIADFDGDGIPDIAVGAPEDDNGGSQKGVFWIIFLNTDGTVKSSQKISDTDGGFGGIIDDGDFFSFALTRLGDLDGNGAPELAVSASQDDDGGIGPPAGHSNRGAIWILFLKSHVPDQITDLSLTVVSPTQVDLQWSEPFDGGSPILGYQIFRNLNGAGPQPITTVPAPQTSPSDTTLSPGDTVTYGVRAVNDVGPGPISNIPAPVTTELSIIEQILNSIAQLIADLLSIENRVTLLEQFNTYQIVSDPLVISPLSGDVRGTISCNGDDPIINASFDSNAINISFQTWKIDGNSLDYFVRNHDGNSVTFTIFLTCKG